MKSPVYCVLSLLLCGATSSLCEAQQKSSQLSPTETVDLFLTAQTAERWAEAAHYLDRQALERIRQREVQNNDSAYRFPWTVEKLMKEDASMPREVAEYEIRRMDRQAKDFEVEKTWSYEFADVENRRDLQQLAGDRLAQSWLKAHSRGYRTTQNSAACQRIGGAPPKAPPSVGLSQRTYRILGQVVTDSMAYVLKEDGYDGKTSNPLADIGIIVPPETFILRKVAGAWKILPSVRTGASIVSIDCVVDSASRREKK